MKALTICQPFAHLIMTGVKRVENRTWSTRYRGLLYIHAGKSRNWLEELSLPDTNMAFGAVIALANLADCVQYNQASFDKESWLKDHQHAFGPWCWILESVVPIGPWPYRGKQGLFDIDSEELDRVANQELGK